MPATQRQANLTLATEASSRIEKLTSVNQQATTRLADPAYANHAQQANLQKVIGDCERQQKVLTAEIEKRRALENAYSDAGQKIPKPKNPDQDAVVVAAKAQLVKHRQENKRDYPKSSLVGGCVACSQGKLDTVQPYVGKTSPGILDPINKDMGTNVNFDNLSRFEGDQYLSPYIPCSEGKVAGASGATVATGFDVGQISEAQLKAMDIPESAKSKLKPLVNKSYKGQDCKEARKTLAALKTERLTQEEADAVDLFVHKDHLKSAVSSFDAAVPKGGKPFSELSEKQQTVLFSRTFHQGKGMPSKSISKDFYDAAVKGDWVLAEENLRNYPVTEEWYKQRVAAEADILKQERLQKLTVAPTLP